MYLGASPFSALYTSSRTLNWMRNLIGSQWSLMRTGVICSYFLVLDTILAALHNKSSKPEEAPNTFQKLSDLDQEYFTFCAAQIFLSLFVWSKNLGSSQLWPVTYGRDIAKARPACLMHRQFSENLFGQAKISTKNFHFWLFGDNNRIFFNMADV